MENKSSKNVVIWIIVLVHLVLLAAWWLFRGSATSNNLAAVGNLTSTASSTSLATIRINDQFPGNVIFVSDVQLPDGGWVVIKKDNYGRPGDIVGAGYFGSNIRVGEVAVPSTASGENYFAVLYDDNGDQRFTLGGDKPLFGANGDQIMTSFVITQNLPDVKG